MALYTSDTLHVFRLRYKVYGKPWLGTVVLVPVCLFFLFTYRTTTVMDRVDLIFHEAGHVLFAPLGEVMHLWGGTLFQLLLPLFFLWLFGRQRSGFGVQVMLVWLGQNLLNVSRYAADARLQERLIAGSDWGRHDWHLMLSGIGGLPYDQAIGSVLFATAMLAFTVALVYPRFEVDALEPSKYFPPV